MPDRPPEKGADPDVTGDKLYWCDICRQTFDSKRCPQCGLKLKRVG